MAHKPTIIIIEDEEIWLTKLSKLVLKYFDVKLEVYPSFNEAETRLMDSSVNFDLLITDIYPDKKSKQTKGLQFVDFANQIKYKPVIVVTGEPSLVKTILNNYEVINAFDKGGFERIDFINAIGSVINSKKAQDTQDSNDNSKNSENPEDFIVS